MASDWIGSIVECFMIIAKCWNSNYYQESWIKRTKQGEPTLLKFINTYVLLKTQNHQRLRRKRKRIDRISKCSHFTENMVSENFQHFRFFDPLKIQNTQNLVLKKFSILGSSVYAWFEKSTISVKVSLYRGPKKSSKSPILIPHC